jgi:hypothetical protein
MSFVIATPDTLVAAASDLSGIGSALGSATAAAAAQTTSLAAAGADELSAAIAALFGDHAQAFQSISVQAARFHDQFVQALHAGTASYASAEAANASPLKTLQQDVLGAINTPFVELTGRPLIGNGANGGTGGSGGLLLGLDGVNGLT